MIPVDIAGAPYEVRIGIGLLSTLVAECGDRLRKPRVPIVTDVHREDEIGAADGGGGIR